jgi:hypothetical protein
MTITSGGRLLMATVLAATAVGGFAAAPVLSADRSDASAQEILRDVQADLAKVRSFHIAGVSRDADGTTRLSADVTTAGSLRLRASMSGQAFTLLKVHNASFLRANLAYWRNAAGASSADASRLADRWIRLDAATAKALAPVYEQLTPQYLARCVSSDLGTIRKVGTGTIGGRKAIILEDAGDKPGSSPGRLWVPVSGAALPLRETQTGPEKPGGATTGPCADDDDEPDTTRSADLRLTQYNHVPTIRAPKGALKLPSRTTQA